MNSSSIAIVGMSGRFPGAPDLGRFWRNLRDGIESIQDRSDAELLAAGVTTEELANPDYVRRAAILDDVPMFDAAFFGLSPRDASIMDPQHRHFLECAWEALEDAAHPPQSFAGSIGVFCGSGMNSYLIHNLLANRKLLASSGLFQLKQTGNDKDVLATRVAYQFDLRGPAINVQTACSTSLVAVHLACQSLLNQECDMALAGGVTIEFPHGAGYIYHEGEILSRDGHCRSFDATSSGTVFSSGLGLVVLRRLEDAIADNDQIHTVILGSAINNDGARKVGFLAPSVEGQAEVVAEALGFAGVSADEIGYVETHGTGTVVGDPIEIRALTQAFRESTDRTGFCAIGSLKSAVGHLDAAAGVAGLIKTVLALKHRQLPPSLNFNQINPRIPIDESPFFVNDRLREWPAAVAPRRAGVTALGIGGTNAHVVLEEAPKTNIEHHHKPYQLLTVSAKTATAADLALKNLAEYLQSQPEVALADAAFTSQLGRHAFAHRRAVAVADTPEARASLTAVKSTQIAKGTASSSAMEVVFLFSGQGSQYVGMGRDLYLHEPVFQQSLDHCAALLRETLGIDLVEAIYPTEENRAAAVERIHQTWLTQPALFSIEYALAQWWISLGLKPVAMVGHSIGEYVAATLAGVFSLEDALKVVALRGRLIYALPAGSMLAVPLSPEEVALPAALSLAAVNNPRMCVVSGPHEAVDTFEEDLKKKDVGCRRLITSHAFHSAMMEPMLAEFEQRLRAVPMQAPRTPYLSNVTGTWITAEEATNPNYWARHIRQTVRFSENLSELLKTPNRVLLECGPGNVLTALSRQQGGEEAEAFASLPHPRETTSALACAMATLGHLWTLGCAVDFVPLHAAGSAGRVSLPTYPFEHQRYWIEPDTVRTAASAALAHGSDINPLQPLSFYRRTWKPAPIAAAGTPGPVRWILFRDATGLADRVATTMRVAGSETILVDTGSCYGRRSATNYTVRPTERADYEAMLADLEQGARHPLRLLHLWSLDAQDAKTAMELCLQSPLALAQALTAREAVDAEIVFATSGLMQVADEPVAHPERAVLLGPARVLPRELAGAGCRVIDLDLAASTAEASVNILVQEICSQSTEPTVAYRKGERFSEALEPAQLTIAPAKKKNIIREGVYIITGGLGSLGLELAEELARGEHARLILVGRSAMSLESAWEQCLRDASLSASERTRLNKLIEIRKLAAALVIAQADVTDAAAIARVVEDARRRFGRIDGVFHAAGVLDDAPLLTKTAASAARVLAPKVQGTLALEAAFGGELPPLFVLFSSVSALAPPAGQVDYAAANAFLDAFAASHAPRVQSVSWGAWREVGMAARSGSPHPFLDERLLDTASQSVYASRLSGDRHWFLSEHTLKSNGSQLAPGTSYIEMATAALKPQTRSGTIEYRDIFFLAPLLVPAGADKDLRVQLEAEAGGQQRFTIFAGAEGAWTEQATGTLAFASLRPAGAVIGTEILSRCAGRTLLFDDAHRTRQEEHFNFGPRWRCLKRLHQGQGEALAELELDARFATETGSLRLHPALLDLATGAALYLIPGYGESQAVYLPLGYGKLTSFHPLPARFLSHIRARGSNSATSETVTFDLTLFDETNQVLAEIEGFTMRRLERPEDASGLASKTPQATAQPIAPPATTAITVREGLDALRRILASDTPPAIAVTRQNIAELTPAFTRSQTPSTSPAATAAEGSIETTLTALWQELLGVENLSLDDDFFALGGHSLTGVRLITRVKKLFSIELELATLFQARTLRQLADLVASKQKPAASKPETAQSFQFQNLVPIQPRGARAPLFCVHAVGGDVIFYEQLARALGPEQPFYAFKSPLVSDPDKLETTMEELAATFIREMRAFYPQGPYLLGGASYGGLIVFEMARQLLAQGIEPGAVFLFDTSVPDSEQRIEATQQFATFARQLREKGWIYLWQKIQVKKTEAMNSGKRHFRSLLTRLMHKAGHKLPIPLRYLEIESAHWHALRQYRFQPYGGKLTLFRATDRGPDAEAWHEDPTLGWQPLALGGLEIIDVPTAHMLMLFEPHVGRFAKLLRTLLPS